MLEVVKVFSDYMTLAMHTGSATYNDRESVSAGAYEVAV